MDEVNILDDEQRSMLLQLARQAIASRFGGEPPPLPTDPVFRNRYGLFVSLHLNGDLRGCIGYIKGYKPLAESVIEMAKAAAFQDPRFHPVSAEEVPKLEIEISILSEMIPVTDVSEIEIGRDGLYLEHPRGSGLLLPQVPVEWNWDRDTFLQHICRKAGVRDKSYLDPQAQLSRFTAEVFHE